MLPDISPESCVLLMVKYPEVGAVKTRLTAAIGSNHTLHLYRSFVEDLLVTMNAMPVQTIVCYHPARALDAFKTWLGDNYVYQAQQGDNLGERLKHVIQEIFAHGYRYALAVGSDSPDLPLCYIEEALDRLRQQTEVVIGPAQDGGYYLIGFRQTSFHKSLFDDICWSTQQVFETTLAKIRAQNLSCHVLPVWDDVDTVEDLKRLYLRNQNTAFRRSKTMNVLHHLFHNAPEGTK